VWLSDLQLAVCPLQVLFDANSTSFFLLRGSFHYRMFRMSTLLRAVPRGMHPLTPTTQVSTGFVKVKQNSFVEGTSSV
jgi:hypothetical protein